jgi:hypothetical protein
MLINFQQNKCIWNVVQLRLQKIELHKYAFHKVSLYYRLCNNEIMRQIKVMPNMKAIKQTFKTTKIQTPLMCKQ